MIPLLYPKKNPGTRPGELPPLGAAGGETRGDFAPVGF